MVYSGTEDFDLDRQIARLRAENDQGKQVIVLDGRDSEGSDVVAACQEHSFLDERDRLVIVDHAESLKNTAGLKAFIESKDPSDMTSVLVAVLRPTTKDDRVIAAKITEVWVKAAKVYAKTFDQIPSYKTGPKLTRLNEEAGIIGLRLAKGVDEGLLQLVGDDLYVLTNELRKLSLLVGEQGTVTLDHVRKVVAQKPPATAFDVADAACEKNIKRAMNLVSYLYRYEGEDKATLKVSSALIRNVEHLLVTRSMLDARKSPEEIAARLVTNGKPMNIYLFKAKFLLWATRQDRPHTVASLRKNLANLCRLDANIKGPSRSKRTQVELAVLSIAS
jgi:DNA polymerase III delta subunit